MSSRFCLTLIVVLAACSSDRDSVAGPSRLDDGPRISAALGRPATSPLTQILTMPEGTVSSTARAIDSTGLVVGSLIGAGSLERAWMYQYWGSAAALGFKALPNALAKESARATGAWGGLISGYAYQGGIKRAVYWTAADQVMHVIPMPAGTGESEATAVGRGVVVGWYVAAGSTKAFRFVPRSPLVTLNVIGKALGVSEDGRFVVGGFLNQSVFGSVPAGIGFIWDAATGSAQLIAPPIRNQSPFDDGTAAMDVNLSGAYAFQWKHVEPSGLSFALADVRGGGIWPFDYGAFLPPYSLSNPYRGAATGVTNSGYVSGWAFNPAWSSSSSAFLKAPNTGTPVRLGDGAAFGITDVHCSAVGQTGAGQAVIWEGNC